MERLWRRGALLRKGTAESIKAVREADLPAPRPDVPVSGKRHASSVASMSRGGPGAIRGFLVLSVKLEI